MQKFYKIFFGLICLVLVFSASGKVLAADKDCRCATDLDVASATSLYKKQAQVLKSICVEAAESECNTDSQKKITKGKLSADCWRSASAELCTTKSQEWQVKYDSMLKEGKTSAESSAVETPSGSSALSSLIIKCGAAGKIGQWPPECTDVTVFVSLLLQMTNYLFGIIGALALGVFVYGGFQLIISQGNPEKVKAGTGAMINAVIGLLIAFGGYVLVSYLGEILKLKSEFGLMK
ncbi:MAG: pilin [Candidatus Magasanikbacteria bacterium]